MAHLAPDGAGNDPKYLTTTPGTQVIFECRMWCAGHGWRFRRGLGWLHQAGHRLRLLRNQPARIRVDKSLLP